MIDLLDRLKSHKVLSYSGTQDILLDASFHIAGDLTVSGSYPSGGGTGTAGSTFIGSLWTTSEAQGDLIYRNATGWTRLAAGTSGNFLKTAGAAEDPVWASTTVTDTSSLVPYSGAVSGIQLGDFGISTTGSYVGALPCQLTPSACSGQRGIICNTIGCYYELAECTESSAVRAWGTICTLVGCS